MNNDRNHYFIRMDSRIEQRKAKKAARRAKKLSEKKFDSPIEKSTDHQQNDPEGQSSDDEIEVDEGETVETAFKAIPDVPESTKVNSSAVVP